MFKRSCCPLFLLGFLLAFSHPQPAWAVKGAQSPEEEDFKEGEPHPGIVAECSVPGISPAVEIEELHQSLLGVEQTAHFGRGAKSKKSRDLGQAPIISARDLFTNLIDAEGETYEGRALVEEEGIVPTGEDSEKEKNWVIRGMRELSRQNSFYYKKIFEKLKEDKLAGDTPVLPLRKIPIRLNLKTAPALKDFPLDGVENDGSVIVVPYYFYPNSILPFDGDLLDEAYQAWKEDLNQEKKALQGVLERAQKSGGLKPSEVAAKQKKLQDLEAELQKDEVQVKTELGKDAKKPIPFYLSQTVNLKEYKWAKYSVSEQEQKDLKRKVRDRRNDYDKYHKIIKMPNTGKEHEIKIEELEKLARLGDPRSQYDVVSHLIKTAPERAEEFAVDAYHQGFSYQRFEKPTPEKELKEFMGEMVEVKGGTFMMGSPKAERTDANFKYYDREKQHKQTVPDSFLGKNMVTQREYLEITGTNPSQHQCEDCPVTNVNYSDIQNYFKKLNARIAELYPRVHPGKPVPKFRLPNEVLWEYATTEDLGLGHDAQGRPELSREGLSAKHMKYSGTNDERLLKDFAVYSEDPNHQLSHVIEVAKRIENSRKLNDMTGLAWEWTSTVFNPKNDAPKTHLANLENPPAGSALVCRGGSFRPDMLSRLRASVRSRIKPGGAGVNLGFRREMYF